VSSSAAGTAFGRYELTELLAVGGMAEVFVARTQLAGVSRRCVIKRILPAYSTNRSFVSMFIDEARITIGLNHDNIAKLLDFGQVDGAYFMAIEYVDGGDLVDVLRAARARQQGIPPLAAAYIARAVARGLHAAHTAVDHRGQPLHIVHRDVSPHNIFVSFRGDVKIGDFGIASAANKLHGKTTPGTVKGKYGYMSPEQTMGARADRRTDVWALGVVLWEMLVGGRLFASDNPLDTISRVNDLPIVAPSSIQPEVPAALDAVVLHALQRPLTLRCADAAEFAAALDAVVGDAFTAAHLDAYLSSLGLSPKVLSAARARQRARPRTMASSIEAPAGDATLAALYEQLHTLEGGQGVWTLVDVGERYAALGQRAEAVAAIRAAAAVFAHRGLLVQAVCAAYSLRPLVDVDAFPDELEALAHLRGHDRLALETWAVRCDRQDVSGGGHVGRFLGLLRDADPAGLGADVTEPTMAHDTTPLLGSVSVPDFVRLAKRCRIERRARGATIVREGERSDALYAVGRGRVVVKAAPTADAGIASDAAVVSVAALTDGDFFGEFSFLTQSPRSATVEADTDVVVLRLDRADVDALVSDDSAFREPLRQFYKERVAELLLAKNPIIGALPADQRRALIVNAEVRSFDDGATIVHEGEDATELFFILAGEVEVSRVEHGVPVFINKLQDGQFFGEMAVLQQRPRTASVQAMGVVDVLCIARADIEALLVAADDVRELFDRAMARRAAESDERVRETTRIFAGV
jgi:CRP-like cAMP-binding protein